jgi:hypothetical protein
LSAKQKATREDQHVFPGFHLRDKKEKDTAARTLAIRLSSSTLGEFANLAANRAWAWEAVTVSGLVMGTAEARGVLLGGRRSSLRER